MSHNKYFLENFVDDEIIENIRSEILDFSLQDDSSIQYIKNINKFLQKNNIVLEDLIKNDLSHTIVYEYWQNILNIYKHMQSHTNWSKDTLNNYVISSTRIQEFLIFLFKIAFKIIAVKLPIVIPLWKIMLQMPVKCLKISGTAMDKRPIARLIPTIKTL
mgnify:CR=1 FL=1